MAAKNIITINGRTYDALTGMPTVDTPGHSQPKSDHHAQASPHRPHRSFTDISGPARLKNMSVIPDPQPRPGKPAHAEVKAHAVHQKPQKSNTLHRAALKKPAPLRPLTPAPVKIQADYTKPSIQRSPVISKFSPASAASANPLPAQPQSAHQLQPRVHPIVAKALVHHAAPSVPQTPQQLKESLIRERLAEADSHTRQPRSRRMGQPRLATILTSSLALLLLAGYLTYINLPNISMRVAATRAGISANYPTYQPDGYSFAGPITYQPGEVNIPFKSNTNERSFVINQKASNWDSQAVLDNFVSKKTGTYLTYQERGLTIYSFGNQAAWVNGGLLYTIDGNAPLSSEQLLRIATSM